jgi:uncharacterized membrane protein YeaQ/YmgE (transglycosylase-associated protein family)
MVELVVWILIGALAGSLVGLVVKRNKKGFGWLINVGIGMVGALIGGFLFDVLRIDFGLANITISLQDIVAAFVGSLIFLAILFFVRRAREKKAAAPENNNPNLKNTGENHEIRYRRFIMCRYCRLRRSIIPFIEHHFPKSSGQGSNRS